MPNRSVCHSHLHSWRADVAMLVSNVTQSTFTSCKLAVLWRPHVSICQQHLARQNPPIGGFCVVLMTDSILAVCKVWHATCCTALSILLGVTLGS